MKHVIARLLCMVTLGFMMAVAALCQTSSSYQAGTIMDVKPHAAPGKEASAKQYDVSVKVGNIVYVVLYTPPKGSNLVEYKTGMDLLVLVQGKTIKFSDMTGHTETVPILSQKEVPIEKGK